MMTLEAWARAFACPPRLESQEPDSTLQLRHWQGMLLWKSERAWKRDQNLLSESASTVSCSAFSPSCRLLACGDSEGVVRVVDVRIGIVFCRCRPQISSQPTLSHTSSSISQIMWSTDSTRISITYDSVSIRLIKYLLCAFLEQSEGSLFLGERERERVCQVFIILVFELSGSCFTHVLEHGIFRDLYKSFLFFVAQALNRRRAIKIHLKRRKEKRNRFFRMLS